MEIRRDNKLLWTSACRDSGPAHTGSGSAHTNDCSRNMAAGSVCGYKTETGIIRNQQITHVGPLRSMPMFHYRPVSLLNIWPWSSGGVKPLRQHQNFKCPTYQMTLRPLDDFFANPWKVLLIKIAFLSHRWEWLSFPAFSSFRMEQKLPFGPFWQIKIYYS